MHACVHARMHMDIGHVCLYIYKYTHIYIHNICSFLFACICICICICICLYTGNTFDLGRLLHVKGA